MTVNKWTSKGMAYFKVPLENKRDHKKSVMAARIYDKNQN
jgi:hypothetical protein